MKMKLRKCFSLLVCLGLSLGVLTGCGQSSVSGTTSESVSETASISETASGGETGEIEVWVYGWETDALKLFQEDALTYSEQHPGVTVKITAVASDVMSEKLNATMAGGTNPDIAMAPSGIKPVTMASKDVLLSVTDMGLEDIESKFYSGTWEANRWGDDVYAVPITANNLALYYNKELFDNAGIEYPNADWNWEDLLAAAKTLTDSANGIYGLDMGIYTPGDEWNVFMFSPFLFQSGGNILSADYKSSAFDSDAARDTMKLYNQLLNEDKSMPKQAPGAGIDRFLSGLVAMNVTGPWNLSNYMNDPTMKDKIGVVPLPSNKEEATCVGGEVMIAFKNTKYPQIVSDYMRHITTDPEFIEKFYSAWTTVPPIVDYKNFYADDEYGEYLKVFIDQMDTGRSRQFVPQWPQIENVVNTALTSYLNNGMDVDEVLKNADAEINSILNED